MAARPPNLLLIMADQLGAACLPTHGHGLVHAPELTALADRATVFERAYCPSPLCAPSRASLLTGRLPSGTGVFDNAADMRTSLPTVTHHLRDRGYYTGLAGKMHFVGPDQLHGFEERLTTDIYPADLDWTPDWRLPPHERLPWYHTMESVLRPGCASPACRRTTTTRSRSKRCGSCPISLGQGPTGPSSWSRPSRIRTIRGRWPRVTGTGTTTRRSTFPPSGGLHVTRRIRTAGGSGTCAASTTSI